ncbi:MAG: aminotransferase class I/II-fold pyridoxal phosphate-dependent enzyme [Pelobium sp.]
MEPIFIPSGYQSLLKIKAKNHLFFGGTSYLGLNYNQAYLQLFKDGLDQWGLNNGASRNNNIRLSIYQEAERQLAINYDREAAVTFSSGWLAAQVAVETFSKNRTLIYINDAHPALMQNDVAILKINDAINYINLSQQTNFLLVSNSVNNIIPQIFDFSALSQILPSKNILLLLDHSHGFGILEQEWRKTLPLNFQNITIIYCGSFAKGLSLDAGVVLGDEYLIDELKNTATFNGASPCSPASLYTYLNGSEIIKIAQEKLKANLDFLNLNLNKNDFFWQENFPVIQILNPEIIYKLQKPGILYTAFPYPNPTSALIHRLVITANHDVSALQHLIQAIN